MRKNTAFKKVPLPAWLAACLGFPLPFPAERTTHSLVLVLSSTYLQLLSPPLLLHEALLALEAATEQGSSSWPKACTQSSYCAGLFWTGPFFCGTEGVCAWVLQQTLHRGSRSMGHTVGEYLVVSIVCAASEDDGLLTESCHIPSWQPQSCFSVSTRQDPRLDQFRAPIPNSCLRNRYVLALSKLIWTA